GIVAKPFHAFSDFDEGAEGCHPQDFAVYDVADAMVLEERFTDVRLQLLYAEREAPLIGIYCQHYGLHAVTLLQNFRGMFHALGPAEIADVHEAVDAFFDLNERAEVGEIAHSAFNGRANGVFLHQGVPGIRRQLAHAERYSPLGGIHTEYNTLDLIIYIDQLRWMLGPLRPGHFADMDEAFDPLLQLNERSVIGHTNHAPVNVRADRIAVL